MNTTPATWDRNCYSMTTEAPVLKLRGDRTDRELKAAQSQGAKDFREGRIIHANNCLCR